MEEVLEHFFMSYPTFYRTIRRINRWFNGLYNIQVSTKPLAITGNENEPLLLWSVLAERWLATTWPFDDIKEAYVAKFMATFIKILDRPLDFSSTTWLSAPIPLTLSVTTSSVTSPSQNQCLDLFAQALEQKADQEFIRSLSVSCESLWETSCCLTYLPILAGMISSTPTQDMLKASRLQASIHTSLTQAQLMIEDIRQHFNLEISNPEVLTILFHNASSVECYEVFAKSGNFPDVGQLGWAISTKIFQTSTIILRNLLFNTVKPISFIQALKLFDT